MFGVSVRLPEPGLVEVLGYAGVDYVLIDAEHDSIGWTGAHIELGGGPRKGQEFHQFPRKQVGKQVKCVAFLAKMR